MKIYSKYFKKYAIFYIIGILCVGLESICDLMGPTLMAKIIDNGVRSGQLSIVINLGWTMLFITLLGAIFAAIRNITASNTAQFFGEDLRNDVFEKIIKFSEESVDNIESGSLITRMTSDTTQITNFVNGTMRFFFKAPIICIGSIVLAIMLSPKMSLIMIGVVLIISVLIGISMSMSYKRFSKVQYALDRVNTVAQEYLMGVRLVKAFGRFSDEENKFELANSDLAQKNISTQLVIAISSPLMSLAIGLGIALVLYIGSILFGTGEIEVGKIAAFITYMTQILHSLIMITNIFNVFVRTKASTQRINEILQSGEDFASFAPQKEVDKASISFENVRFRYPGGSGKPALDGISFSVDKGESLAIIGPTGSGKSTLAWLMLGFYPLTKGNILLNGEDITKIEKSYLRENIAIAPQKSMLFTGSVFDNIKWGKPSATKEMIVSAAKVAQADYFISQMNEGYESLLGQAGVNLSGGQKQRISIARAVVKNSPILILDDCTSALDAVTEAKVRKSLKELPGVKTIILITQRIGTALGADKILVLDNGKVVGIGTHKELIVNCSTYKEIYDSQIGSEEVENG